MLGLQIMAYVHQLLQEVVMRSNDRAAQRKIILDTLRERSLTTIEARERFGIMHPGGRVLELRKQGYNIITHWANENDASGQIHRVAHYILISSKKGRGV